MAMLKLADGNVLIMSTNRQAHEYIMFDIFSCYRLFFLKFILFLYRKAWCIYGHVVPKQNFIVTYL